MTILDATATLYRNAMPCNACFGPQSQLQRPIVDVPQPRWVGPKYPAARPRVLVVALNPGAGTARHAASNQKLHTLLHNFRDGSAHFDDVLAFQRSDMFTWGTSPGVFTRFYSQATGKQIEELAFLNLALCATKGNEYPAWILNTCLSSHTGKLLEALSPDIVLLSGSATHKFDPTIQRLLPSLCQCSTMPIERAVPESWQSSTEFKH